MYSISPDNSRWLCLCHYYITGVSSVSTPTLFVPCVERILQEKMDYRCALVALLLSMVWRACEGNHIDPEVDMTPVQLITSKGYPGQEHFVQTPDGYILALHRIPYGKDQKPGPRPVFFLQHGLLCSSTNWLTNLVNESFAYILADRGFDVWMGNVRGNTYSRNHTHLKPSQREFWEFSFDEHAQTDLPTMLDYVLKVTNQSDLFYVGHSQGTIMGFAGFTFNQSLASHIKAFFALAPVATVKNIKGAFRVIADHDKILGWVLKTFTTGEFIPSYELIRILGKYVCSADMELVDGVCENIIFLICGFDQNNINISRIPVYYTHTPAGTSVKNTLHLAQHDLVGGPVQLHVELRFEVLLKTREVHSGRFAMYDYGEEENRKLYGVSPSPAYNVSDLTVPVALFTGSRDWLADPQDVAGLIPLLNSTGNLIYHKNIDYYDHLDFIWGMDAPIEVYPDIIKLADKMRDRS